MDIDIVRQELIEYVENKGIKYRWIARQIGVSDSMLNHFKQGRKKINKTKLKHLHDLINS